MWYNGHMTKAVHIEEIKDILRQFDPGGSSRYFLFGSAVRRSSFHDIDLGVMGDGETRKRLGELRERFYHSKLPYKVDVVDFDSADQEFRDYVFSNEPIVWIQ
jgi:predicted nucleotidyltransferase